MKSAEEFEGAGRDLWHRGEYEQALKVLQEGLLNYPKHKQLRLGVAMAQLRLGNFVAARDILLELEKDMPGNGDVLAALAETYLNLGKKKDALNSVKAAAAAHKNSPVLKEYLALMLSQHGLFREAVVYYKQVIAAASDRPYSHYGLG